MMLTVWMYCSEESSGLCSRGRGAVAAAEHRGVGGQPVAAARARLAAPARAVEQTAGMYTILSSYFRISILNSIFHKHN